MHRIGAMWLGYDWCFNYHLSDSLMKSQIEAILFAKTK